MVDREVLDGLLAQLGVYARRLRDAVARPRDETLSSTTALSALKYDLVVAVGACVDAAHHIIASEGSRRPGDLGDSFTVLREERILDADLAVRLTKAVGLRNLLVHSYATVDDARMLDDVAKGIGDFDAFAAAVVHLLEDTP